MLDGAVFIIEGVAGVQPQSETNWRLADRYNVPRIIFINKLDRTGADFYRAFDTLKEKLDIIALPLQLPIGVEDSFIGVVDLVEMKAIIWEGGELGAKFHDEEIPADMMEKAKPNTGRTSAGYRAVRRRCRHGRILRQGRRGSRRR